MRRMIYARIERSIEQRRRRSLEYQISKAFGDAPWREVFTIVRLSRCGNARRFLRMVEIMFDLLQQFADRAIGGQVLALAEQVGEAGLRRQAVGQNHATSRHDLEYPHVEVAVETAIRRRDC